LRIHFRCLGERFMGISILCEFDPSQVGRWGQIDLSQMFCPRLFRSLPMPAGYRWVPVGNARALRDKFGVCLHQRFLAFSCQFITADGVGNSHCNPFCNRRAITAVDNPQFQRLEVSDRRYADVLYSGKHPQESKAIPTPSCTRSITSCARSLPQRKPGETRQPDTVHSATDSALDEWA
jgi:hypothetical protein